MSELISYRRNKLLIMIEREITSISLKDAAMKYSITSATLLEWAKEGKVVMFRKDGVFFDENTIKAYYEFQKILEKHAAYLEKMIAEKEQEISDSIALYDDYLFSMRTLSKNKKIFVIIIRELAEVIVNKENRDIFIRISLGERIYNVAREYSLTYDRVCAIYVRTVNLVEKRAGLFKKYKAKIVELGKKNQEIHLLYDNLKATIVVPDNDKKISVELSDKSIPDDVLRILSLSLREDMELDLRTKNCLYNAELYTVADLLRYLLIHDGKINSLFKIDKLGRVSFNRLKKVLEKMEIIDNMGNSHLFKYLI